MDIYELLYFASQNETFLLGGRGIYSGSLDTHFMHVDIGPMRTWATMPNSDEQTTFTSRWNAATANYKAKYITNSYNGFAAFNALFTYFSTRISAIARQADIALQTQSKQAVEANESTDEDSWKKFITTVTETPKVITGEPIEASLSDHSPINIDYGLAYVHIRQECTDNIDSSPYIALNPLNYKQDEYKFLPWAGEYRNFIIEHIISPKYAARWSVTGQVIKTLIAGQAMTLSNIEYRLWDIVQLFLGSLMYQFVPIPFGGRFTSGDTVEPKMWAVVPRIETVDIDSTCVPIPEVNKFYSTGSWSNISYSVNIRDNPTAVAGLINVGDASVIGDQTSTLSRIASLFPIDLAVRVEGDDRDMKLRTEFTIEENWRGPNRVFKDYDLFRLGLLSAELAKSSKAQQYIEVYKNQLEEEQLYLLIHDMALRDYYAAVLGQNQLSFSVGYWPYLLVGYPAQFVTDQFNIYGIINGVSISGSGNHIQTTVYLRNAFNDWDKPYRLLAHNLGQASQQSIYDPWLLDIDLANIKSLLVSIGAAESNNGLTYNRTRQLFYVNEINDLKIRKQMKDLVNIYSQFLRGTAMARAWDLFSDKLVNLYSQDPNWHVISNLLTGESQKASETNE